mmetsp:Transcript_26074/g.40795  ORF Transcript_26074/g.40795 Transcript_26074/m.40795 type:complete len:380 (-) Transcript_26074:583-1722(-)
MVEGDEESADQDAAGSGNDKEKGEGAEGAEKDKKPEANQDIQAEFKCSICLQVFYKCCTLIPCMHNFCSACYSQWMTKDGGKTCPECRDPTTEVRRNHTLVGIIEKYLEAHPQFKRTAEDLAEMDAENKITDEFLRVSRKRNRDDDDSSVFDSDEEYRCPNCDTAAPDGVICPTNGNHEQCDHCGDPFPSRAIATDRTPQVPSGKCEGCNYNWCAPYKAWIGATSACIRGSHKLDEFSFDMLPNTIFSWNRHERQITEEIMQLKSMDATALFRHCLNAARNGTITIPDTLPLENGSGLGGRNVLTCFRQHLNHESLCPQCINRLFASLAYGWREGLQKSELPTAAAAKPDCHWGSNCRTQRHNPGHASRFNHCCVQTRF